jgi:molybdopterin/thiamine biosynthesis adenylyltransferase
MLQTELITRRESPPWTALERSSSDTLDTQPKFYLRGARILVAGAGNIGSPTVQLLAQAGVSSLRIVDRDSVEAANLATQGYLASELGQYKAHALGRRIQQTCPGVKVQSFATDLEDLPLGVIEDVDLVIGALDSRRARQALISEIAWPQGLTVVDGAVGVAAGLVGRVQVLRPGPASACLECAFSEADYRLLVAEYPCNPGFKPAVPPTGAPAFLGTAVASVIVAEAARALSGQRPAGSYEVVFDLWSSRFIWSRLRRSPCCRFDHVVVSQVVRLDRPLPLATAGDLLASLERLYPGQAVHLECRRGLRLATPASRFIPLATLEALRDKPLLDFGLTPADRLRVRAERGPEAFVDLNGPSNPAEERR